jgi:hypothetical protein
LIWLVLVVFGPGWVDVEQVEDVALGGGEPVEAEPVRGVGGTESLEGGEDVAAGGSGGARCSGSGPGSCWLAHIGFDQAEEQQCEPDDADQRGDASAPAPSAAPTATACIP